MKGEKTLLALSQVVYYCCCDNGVFMSQLPSAPLSVRRFFFKQLTFNPFENFLALPKKEDYNINKNMVNMLFL